MTIDSLDPRTGQIMKAVSEETTREEIDALCRNAASATWSFEDAGREGRAEMLGAVAAALDENRERIVNAADRESALGEGRLAGELTRCTYQLRLFADALEEGSYLEAIIDHAADTPMGPRPDLRRMLVPVGPVVVFGASNFPLAFSVAGGDCASALASGCPVIVKAHESHPETSLLCFEVMREALISAGAPEAAFQLIFGRDAGAATVVHPAIKAVAFTGSRAGGMALYEFMQSREEPIPFYGELGSLNPVVVTPAAAAERGTQIGQGLSESFMLGGGQFCTKPGLAFVPGGEPGDEVVAALSRSVAASAPRVMLNEPIARDYASGTERILTDPTVELVERGAERETEGFQATPMILTTSASELPAVVTEEVFGPATIVARYEDEELFDAMGRLPASLATAVFHAEDETDVLPSRIAAHMRDNTGRLLFNAFPTGVAVGWAQHHGGPWPSTTSLHSSVGITSIRRFLRPIAFQNAPDELLPIELQASTTNCVRREDGILRVPGNGDE